MNFQQHRDRVVREYCLRDTSENGKMEHCSIYIPYLYDRFLNGFYDDDYGRTIKVTPTDEDRRIFPELGAKDAVYFYEDEHGRVIEVDGPGNDEFEVPDYGIDEPYLQESGREISYKQRNRSFRRSKNRRPKSSDST